MKKVYIFPIAISYDSNGESGPTTTRLLLLLLLLFCLLLYCMRILDTVDFCGAIKRSNNEFIMRERCDSAESVPVGDEHSDRLNLREITHVENYEATYDSDNYDVRVA